MKRISLFIILLFCAAIGIRRSFADTFPIDIRSYVNMGWADEVADDECGGWTDQGDNDVADLIPGEYTSHDITFDLIDPATNDGKSCLAFAGPSRQYFLHSVSLDNLRINAERLYLLHGLAWSTEGIETIGTITVYYEDLSKTDYEVKSNQDVCNWWDRKSSRNALMGWTGRNPHASTTLFISAFPLEESKTVTSIQFIPKENAVWMIAAASCGSLVKDFTPQEKTIMTAGDEWKPMDLLLNVEKNSALDFSFMNSVEAGAYGWTNVVGDHFEFEKKPGEAIRFYGPNLAWSANLPSHEESDELAERFAAIGYNTVRLHHIDMIITETQENGKLHTLDPARMDRLDYLVYAMKKRGIYITTDLYTTRNPNPEDVDVTVHDFNDFKGGIAIIDSIFQNWKDYARLVMTHKNPYTGLEWREDPAIFAICTINENLMPAPWVNHPDFVAAYEKLVRAWCERNNTPFPEKWQSSQEFWHVVTELQSEHFINCRNYLRNELGVKALLTDNNNGNFPVQIVERELLDYTDIHTYFEHPSWMERSWDLPIYYPQESPVKKFCNVPNGVACGRIEGKPIMATEIDYCFPNMHRAEGGVLMGAYGCFQNMDGFYRFSYSHFREAMFEPKSGWMFETVRDPISVLGDRIALMLFLNGKVSPAKKMIPYLYTKADPPTHRNLPERFWKLGLYSGLCVLDATVHRHFDTLPFALTSEKAAGTPVSGVEKLYNADDQNVWSTLENDGIIPHYDGTIISDTGELKINPAQSTLNVITPFTECAVLPARTDFKGDMLAISYNTTTATFALFSQDPAVTLADAKRLLLFHITDVVNSNMVFRDAERTILEAWGDLPLLSRQGTADIILKRGDVQAIWGLDMSGKRIMEIPFSKENDSCAWKVSVNNDANNGIFVYEIVLK